MGISVNYTYVTRDLNADELIYDTGSKYKDVITAGLCKRHHIISKPHMDYYWTFALLYYKYNKDKEFDKLISTFANIVGLDTNYMRSIRTFDGIKKEGNCNYNLDVLRERFNDFFTKAIWAPSNLFLGYANREDDPSQNDEKLPLSMQEKKDKLDKVIDTWKNISSSYTSYSNGNKINFQTKLNNFNNKALKDFAYSFLDYVCSGYTVHVTTNKDWLAVDNMNNRYFVYCKNCSYNINDINVSRYTFVLNEKNESKYLNAVHIIDLKEGFGIKDKNTTYFQEIKDKPIF